MPPINTIKPDTVYLNGIDPESGEYAIPPARIDDLVRYVHVQPDSSRLAEFEAFAPPPDLDATSLAEAGWGVVFADDVSQSLRDALAPLLVERRRQAGVLFKELEYRRGESINAWYDRHNTAFGTLEPTVVPYYVLLIGGPTSIPFEFQFLLGVEYAVGRLSFESAEDYSQYVKSLLAYESGNKVNNAKQIVYWGTQHLGDPATTLSSTLLLDPLANGMADGPPSLKKAVHDALGFSKQAYLGAASSRQSLLSALTAARAPAMLFTASHGMAIRAGRPNQTAENGALLCQDWPGYGSVQREQYFAAEDLPNDANVAGMVAFIFACFGGGTPDRDEFLKDFSQPGAAPLLAPQPFVAALPQRLLAHPRGGALAVIAHVDRAWGFSIQPPQLTGAHIGPFRNMLYAVLSGMPVGYSMTQYFGQRYSALAAALLNATSLTTPVNKRLSDRDLVSAWLETNDARNYVVLGDPAARVRTDKLA